MSAKDLQAFDPMFREHYAPYGAEVTLRIHPEMDGYEVLVLVRDGYLWYGMSDFVQNGVIDKVAAGDEAAFESTFDAVDAMIRRLHVAHGIPVSAKRML